jgi:lantibiotic leader peptide-processing serine protease
VRKVLLVALVVLVAAALALPASAGPSGQAGTAAQSQSFGRLQSADGQYVVAYADGVSAATARAAVKAAGGTILKENARVGVATVRSANPSFLGAAAAQRALVGAARNRPIGQLPSGANAAKEDVERLTAAERAKAAANAAKAAAAAAPAVPGQEPLADKQWDMRMIDATPSGSYRVNQGRRGVMVGIIDSGIDGNHPDLSDNFDRALSRNFVTDIPLIDGPCEHPSCVDPRDEDDNGHGTHVAGLVAAELNGLGTAGVAPKVTLVNIRGGQDSGFVFLQPVVDALVYAGLVGIDVVNMSFYIDPWLYNCLDNPADSPEAQAEQRTVRVAVQRAVNFARGHGVTPVAAMGNGHTDLGNPTSDNTSPDSPPGAAYPRDVDNSCITVPTETRGVISISALGPSFKKADYSNYGIEQTDFSAPGGFFRDYYGSDQYMQVENTNLSTMPTALAEKALAQNPANPFIVKDCRGSVCGYYQYLQGTSMASPHATGVAALVVSAYGHHDPLHGGLTMSPRDVERVMTRTARQTPCPFPPIATYPDRAPDLTYTATCEGTLARNGFYGRGIVNALSAVVR